MFSVDISRSDHGLAEYKDLVSGSDSILRNWGDVIKIGTSDTIARSFFTGVHPVDGLSSLNMVLDLTFDPRFAGMFGLTSDDLPLGLRRIDNITEQQHRLSGADEAANSLMGITAPQAMEIFELDMVSALRSNELFEGGMMGKCLISLAYCHGFLTYKTDKEGRTFLTSPNLVAKAVYVETLIPQLLDRILKQLTQSLINPNVGSRGIK
ncbi:hypothetical protein B484DRAFT_407130 [Ochromonadaceae sp. CCMP2298]|nr:hypothetical protein B484DRAFT_407130 [Ochromonadaceae sp. CCMP2298]